MVISETERRKNIVITGMMGEWSNIMPNLYERYLIAPNSQEQQRLGRVIKRNILEIKKESPVVAKLCRDEFEIYTQYKN